MLALLTYLFVLLCIKVYILGYEVISSWMAIVATDALVCFPVGNISNISDGGTSKALSERGRMKGIVWMKSSSPALYPTKMIFDDLGTSSADLFHGRGMDDVNASPNVFSGLQCPAYFGLSSF